MGNVRTLQIQQKQTSLYSHKVLPCSNLETLHRLGEGGVPVPVTPLALLEEETPEEGTPVDLNVTNALTAT